MLWNTVFLAVGYTMLIVPLLWLARPVRMVHPF